MTRRLTRMFVPVAALLVAACNRREPVNAAASVAVPKAVRTAAVVSSGAAETGRYSAILTPDAQVDLAFRIPGYVVEIVQAPGADGRFRPVEPGYAVRAGTVLARIRPTDYEAVVDKARGAHQESESGIRAAEAQL